MNLSSGERTDRFQKYFQNTGCRIFSQNKGNVICQFVVVPNLLHLSLDLVQLQSHKAREYLLSWQVLGT